MSNRMNSKNWRRKPYQLMDGTYAQGVDNLREESEPLEFVGMTFSKRHRHNGDVWVRSEAEGEPYGKMVATFYNECGRQIGERIVVAESGNRLYFAEDMKHGYKLSKKGCALQVTGSTPVGELLNRYTGTYTLEYDTARGLYYIDKEHELNRLNFIGKGGH